MVLLTKKKQVYEAPSSRHLIRNRPSISVMSAEPASSFGDIFFQHTPTCPCDGGCPRCAPAIQPKLKIGSPNDQYEQEADRVA